MKVNYALAQKLPKSNKCTIYFIFATQENAAFDGQTEMHVIAQCSLQVQNLTKIVLCTHLQSNNPICHNSRSELSYHQRALKKSQHRKSLSYKYLLCIAQRHILWTIIVTLVRVTANYITPSIWPCYWSFKEAITSQHHRMSPSICSRMTPFVTVCSQWWIVIWKARKRATGNGHGVRIGKKRHHPGFPGIFVGHNVKYSASLLFKTVKLYLSEAHVLFQLIKTISHPVVVVGIVIGKDRFIRIRLDTFILHRIRISHDKLSDKSPSTCEKETTEGGNRFKKWIFNWFKPFFLLGDWIFLSCTGSQYRERSQGKLCSFIKACFNNFIKSLIYTFQINLFSEFDIPHPGIYCYKFLQKNMLYFLAPSSVWCSSTKNGKGGTEQNGKGRIWRRPFKSSRGLQIDFTRTEKTLHYGKCCFRMLICFLKIV